MSSNPPTPSSDANNSATAPPSGATPAPAPGASVHSQPPPRHPSAPTGSHAPPSQHPQGQQPNQQMSDSNKRAALAGQWRTPPLPVFPTAVSSNLQPHSHHPPPPPQQAPPQQQASMPPPPPANLPDNSEDYAKALQEAYRRGAEAAAAMAAHQQHMSPSVSCPNFQRPMAAAPPAPPPPQSHVQPIMTSRSEDMTASSNAYSHSHPHTHPPMPPPHPAYHPHPHAPPPVAQPHHATHAPPPPPPHHPHPASHPPHPQYAAHPHPPHQYAAPPSYVAPAPTPTAPAPPPPPPPPPAGAPPQQQQQNASVPNPLTNMPPPPNKQPQTTMAPPPPAPPAGGAQLVVPQAAQQRSVSLPDMTSYAVQAEEEKRQKRLARNRASARLRRLRKKNLVDAYETEVGILEKTLQQLKAHEWGVPAATAANTPSEEKSHQSLLEALCMDRGQQVISSEQRAQQCQDILEQQLQQMELLRQVQFEQQLLAQVAGENKDEDPELAEMAQELDSILNLTDDQKSQLQETSKGLDDEMTALDTVFSSLVMMKENEWLLNQGVQDITDQLTSILHKNQMSKFLLWADANVEAIDQLDHVHAAPKTAPHPHGPIFTFGVETTPMEDEGDGR
ncbi:bZIP transcription factor [Seminavis robusta]|uniref:BZIP transcription factor n=1 Tax=Seminavis robusta TaxID=568900 RepID=A0A9N8DPF5_9STRA|nr:bZIP transcription factor [Seminavis robusta]|eukprot:Sro194_g082710.1 bZIP transcription factor (617) ;mRNA; r:16738-18717